MNWLFHSLSATNTTNADPADIQATLTELTAKTIANVIFETDTHTKIMWVCGGGANNCFLIERLKALLPHHDIVSTEKAGIHPQWIEASAFAWLAKCTLEKKAGNLPSVTGATTDAILGGIYCP